MLTFRNVSVKVGGGVFGARKKEILTDISFTLPHCGALGIVGESGSGKTTIANVVLGLMAQSAGEVCLAGKPVRGGFSRLQLAKKIQLVTQNPETSFDPDVPVGESFCEVMRIHGLMKNRAEAAIKPLLRETGLETIDLGKLPGHFSGGELQRMSIVRALLPAPQIVIFDEADSMLDTLVRLRLFDMLNTLRDKHSLSYIYITHDIRVLPHVVDDVLVLERGKSIALGPVSILKTSAHPRIKMLRTALAEGPCRSAPLLKDERSLR